jgi:FAD binding domain-containing protein/berberine-like enzyme
MGERRVTTISGDIRAISGTTLEAFATQLRGKLLTGDDDGYDTARKVWNGLVDKRPALIARCTGAADVITCVRFARDQDLLLSIHGGGHSIAGRAVCDNGIMIDLSQMKGIRVDPNQQTAFAQPGLRLAEFDHETQAFGLATTLGVASDTGISGLTLGGGYGWLNGRYGLACDNVLTADVVTAEGHLVSASADENADLFWGIRGAGANFGVVTSFQYRLHPVGSVLAGLVLYPISQGRQVLRLYHEFSASCPDEVSTIGLLLSTPDGTPAVGIAACYTGPIDEGERILKPIKTFGPPMLDLVAPRQYTEMQSLFDESWVPGQLNYLKTSLMRALSDTAIDIVLEHALKRPTPTSVIYFQQLHGAASRRRSDETAFPHRFYHYDCGPWAIWRDQDDTDRCITWARSCWEALRQVYEPSAYVNAVDEAVSDDEERVKSAYGPNYQRLAALKAKYDPTNQFRLNANIRSTLEEAV